MSRSYNIKESDIERFFNACDKLNECIEAIREYEPSAHLYVAPNQINLMIGYGDCTNWEVRRSSDEAPAASSSISALDCGDW